MDTIVLVGTAKGATILRSDGERAQWRGDGLQLKGWLVTAATRDAAGRYYAAVTHDVYGAAVMASDDLETWEQLAGAPRYEPGEVGNEGHNRIIGAMDPTGHFTGGGRYVDQIWKLHSVGQILYAGVSEAGLFRSEDRGKTWEPMRGLNDHESRGTWGPGFGGLCAHTILVDEENPDRLWVGISAAGAFRSDDGGQTWHPKNEGVSAAEGYCVHCLAHDPHEADTIYRQDHRGMYRSSDAGDSWQVIENGLPTVLIDDDHECAFGFPVALDPGSQSVYAVPLEGSSFRFAHDGKLTVYRTRDGGEQWSPLSAGLPESCYANVLRGAMALDHRSPCGVYFGTTSGALYGSVNGGDSWAELVRDLPKILCVEAFTE